MQREHALLRDVLASLTGFRLLQVGDWGLAPDVLEHSATLCRWRLLTQPDGVGDVGFDGVNLPVASGHVDALLLPHTLDLVAAPHRLLRDCERVLNDRGQLILLGFNPLSMWGMAQHIPGRGGKGFVKPARLYTAHRVCDWLRLLELEPERIVRYGVGFPFYRRIVSVPTVEGWHRLTAVAWLAQAYMIVARKRVVPLTPTPLRHKRFARPTSGGIPLAHRVNSRHER